MRRAAAALASAAFLAGASGAVAAPADVALEFGAAVPGTLADANGEGTGFPQVVTGGVGSGHAPERLDLRPAEGRLVITGVRGTLGPALGQNAGEDSAQNVLVTPFDAASGTRTITTRLIGSFDPDPADPDAGLVDNKRQAGIILGATQSTYLTLVTGALDNGPTPDEPMIRVVGEPGATGVEYGKVTFTREQYAAIQTLDLALVIDVAAGTADATYAIDGGAPQPVASDVPVAPGLLGPEARAGLLVTTSNKANVPMGFDWFRVSDGVADPGDGGGGPVDPPPANGGGTPGGGDSGAGGGTPAPAPGPVTAPGPVIPPAGGTTGVPQPAAKPRFCGQYPGLQKAASRRITAAKAAKRRATTRKGRAAAARRVATLTAAKRAQTQRFRRVCR